MELVTIHNGQAVTTSRKVAHKFGKQHKDVLRAIRELDSSPEFSQRNFAPSNFTTDRGREYEEYIITRDGFTFLVMGFTGADAARFKEQYIAAFNRMKQSLAQYANDPFIQLRIEQINQGQRLDRIEAQLTTRPNYFTIAGYARLTGVSANYTTAKRLGIQASRICKNRGIQTEPVTDPRFGKVNSYPEDILQLVFNALPAPD